MCYECFTMVTASGIDTGLDSTKMLIYYYDIQP